MGLGPSGAGVRNSELTFSPSMALDGSFASASDGYDEYASKGLKCSSILKHEK